MVEQGKVEVAKFKYKSDYVAAWLSEGSKDLLRSFGVVKLPHLTTFFDGYGQLSSMDPYKWEGVKFARIANVVEWPVGGKLYLVAELDCEWSYEINAHYLAQGAKEDMPHNPHITLAKNVEEGTAANFQGLVGHTLTFVRHGSELSSQVEPFAWWSDASKEVWIAAQEGGYLRHDECDVYLSCVELSAGLPLYISAEDAVRITGGNMRDMDSAPKDGTPILAWCCHEADISTLDEGKTLSDYACACEAFEHVKDGYHVVVWVPEEQEGSWEEGYYLVPGFWALSDGSGGDFIECCANPVKWMPLPVA